MLSNLTVKCKDFSMIADVKLYENACDTKAELRTGLIAKAHASADVNHGINVSERFELHEGLLYRFDFDPKVHGLVYAWCVPRGSVRSTRVMGGRHELSVRTEIISWFHSSEVAGFHSALDAMFGKLKAKHYWPTMFEDCERFIKDCLECRKLRGRPRISPQMRSDLYDGPFVYIFFDHVGPLRPAGKSGCRFLLTAVCAFSGWGWARPVPNTTAEVTGETLVKHVFCDVGGLTIFVRHDRSTSF